MHLGTYVSNNMRIPGDVSCTKMDILIFEIAFEWWLKKLYIIFS